MKKTLFAHAVITICTAVLFGAEFAGAGLTPDEQAPGKELYSFDWAIPNETRTQADKDWADFLRFAYHLRVPGKHDLQLTEKFQRQQRSLGLEFWNDHPKDHRRFLWLILTVGNPPRYLVKKDSWDKVQDRERYTQSVDPVEVAAWQRTYAKLRKEFWSDPKVPDSMRVTLRSWEIFEANMEAAALFSEGKRIDEARLKKNAIDLAKRFPAEDVEFALGFYFQQPRVTGLDDPKEMAAFISSLKKSKNFSAIEYACGRERVELLRHRPFDLTFTAMDGRKVDLQALQGKVVLVDIWGVGCTSCINSMPYLKSIAEKYGVDGFEVVAICLARDEDRPSIEKVVKQVDAPWPTYFTGGTTEGGTHMELRKRFFIHSVPLYLLLNKSGLLVEQFQILDMARLQGSIQRLIREGK